ncbi:MAG: transglutaminase domain-containing protein [Planctomycetaceae bacterium]
MTAGIAAIASHGWRRSQSAESNPLKAGSHDKRRDRRPAAASIDLSHVTLDGTISQCGRDARRLYEFVRTAVRFEPYPGMLRGARGTLVAMAGNAVDQAVLLHALLVKAGFKARIVQGTLPAVQCRDLAASFFPWKNRRGKSDSSSKTNWLSDRQQRQLTTAMNALRPIVEAEHKAKKGTAQRLRDVAGALRKHYWVRYQTGGRWMDLDPTLPTNSFGHTNAVLERFVKAPADLPAHRVRLRIRIQERRTGKTTGTTLCEWAGTSADVPLTGFVIEHFRKSTGSSRSAVGAAGGFAGAFRRGISGASEKVYPLITLTNSDGKQNVVRGSAFLLRPKKPTASKRRLPPGFGRFGFGRRKQIDNGSGVIKEWVEIEVTAPDGTVRRTERLLHGGAELSDAKQVTNRVTVLNVVSGVPHAGHYPSNDVLPPLKAGDHDIWRLLRSLNLLLVAEPAYALSVLRVPWAGFVRYVVDSPQIVVTDIRPLKRGVVVRGDLRSVRPGVVANFDQSRRGQAMCRALRGIVDTQIESSLFRTVFAKRGSLGQTSSAIEILDRVRALHRLESSDLNRLPLSTAVRETAQRHLKNGRVLLGDKRPVDVAGRKRVAWWLIDPRTGETIGVTDEGLHQTSGEYGGTTAKKTEEDERTGAAYGRSVQQGSRQTARSVSRQMASRRGTVPRSPSNETTVPRIRPDSGPMGIPKADPGRPVVRPGQNPDFGPNGNPIPREPPIPGNAPPIRPSPGRGVPNQNFDPSRYTQQFR